MVETDEHVFDVAVLEDPAQHKTLCQNETVFVNLPPPRRSHISLHEIPVNCEKTEESHSTAVQDCAKVLNSEDKREQEYLKESQSTVIQESRFGRVIIKPITDLNIKEILTSVVTDENSNDSSIDGQGSSTSPGVHFPDTVKNSSDPNDNEAAKENIEADILVSIICPTNDCPRLVRRCCSVDTHLVMTVERKCERKVDIYSQAMFFAAAHSTVIDYVGFEVPTAMVMKSSVILFIMPCSPLKVGNMFLQNMLISNGLHGVISRKIELFIAE
jgi:hypothetical protein